MVEGRKVAMKAYLKTPMRGRRQDDVARWIDLSTPACRERNGLVFSPYKSREEKGRYSTQAEPPAWGWWSVAISCWWSNAYCLHYCQLHRARNFVPKTTCCISTARRLRCNGATKQAELKFYCKPPRTNSRLHKPIKSIRLKDYVPLSYWLTKAQKRRCPSSQLEGMPVGALVTGDSEPSRRRIADKGARWKVCLWIVGPPTSRIFGSPWSVDDGIMSWGKRRFSNA